MLALSTVPANKRAATTFTLVIHMARSTPSVNAVTSGETTLAGTAFPTAPRTRVFGFCTASRRSAVMKCYLTLYLGALALALAAGSTTLAGTYTFVSYDSPLGGPDSGFTGINNSGQLVGEYGDFTTVAHRHGF